MSNASSPLALMAGLLPAANATVYERKKPWVLWDKREFFPIGAVLHWGEGGGKKIKLKWQFAFVRPGNQWPKATGR